MNKILEKRQLSETVYYMKFEAADIAKNRKAGQFLIVQYDDEMGERIPLTIADANAEEGIMQPFFCKFRSKQVDRLTPASTVYHSAIGHFARSAWQPPDEVNWPHSGKRLLLSFAC